VIQSRRQFAPNEIIGPTVLDHRQHRCVGVGLAMWAIGLQFYITLALAVLIFLGGGAIVWLRPADLHADVLHVRGWSVPAVSS